MPALVISSQQGKRGGVGYFQGPQVENALKLSGPFNTKMENAVYIPDKLRYNFHMDPPQY